MGRHILHSPGITNSLLAPLRGRHWRVTTCLRCTCCIPAPRIPSVLGSFELCSFFLFPQGLVSAPFCPCAHELAQARTSEPHGTHCLFLKQPMKDSKVFLPNHCYPLHKQLVTISGLFGKHEWYHIHHMQANTPIFRKINPSILRV